MSATKGKTSGAAPKAAWRCLHLRHGRFGCRGVHLDTISKNLEEGFFQFGSRPSE